MNQIPSAAKRCFSVWPLIVSCSVEDLMVEQFAQLRGGVRGCRGPQPALDERDETFSVFGMPAQNRVSANWW